MATESTRLSDPVQIPIPRLGPSALICGINLLPCIWQVAYYFKAEPCCFCAVLRVSRTKLVLSLSTAPLSRLYTLVLSLLTTPFSHLPGVPPLSRCCMGQ